MQPDVQTGFLMYQFPALNGFAVGNQILSIGKHTFGF